MDDCNAHAFIFCIMDAVDMITYDDDDDDDDDDARVALL